MQQIVRAAQLFRFLFKDPDKLLADDLPLSLGLRHARKLFQKALARIDCNDVQIQFIAVKSDDLRRLVLTQQAVIHKDTGQPVADRTMDEHGRHGRIHAARERAQHLALADLFAHLPDQRFRKPLHAVGAFAAAQPEKVLENLLALRRMRDLRMELNAVEPLFIRGKRRNRAVFRGCDRAEALRQFCHGIVVRHPDDVLRHAIEQRMRFKPNRRSAKLSNVPTAPPNCTAIYCIP